MVAGVDMRFICGLDSQMQFLGVFQTAKFATQKSLKYKQKAFSQTVVNSLETQSNVFRQLFVLSVQPYSYTLLLLPVFLSYPVYF